ncbi:MAG: hypothetical protein ACREDY_21820, partial [Bradyrhizobium sp.]
MQPVMSVVRYNWNPAVSTYNQLQTQRLQRKAVNQSMADYSASVAGSINDAMSSQYAGIANLAADAAAKRLGIKLPSQSNTATNSASSTSSKPSLTSSVDHVASMNNYIKSLNQMINGTAEIASQAKSGISSAGSAQAAIANILDGANIGGTSSATVSQIASGTASLVRSA